MKPLSASGKQSLSKMKACTSCPDTSGMSIQLPNHQGLSHRLPFFPHIQPCSSARLYVASAAWLSTYIARDSRSCSPGYTPNIKPAKLAPTAGANRDVRVCEVRGLRRRKGCASGVSRCARRRVKNRKSRRCRRRMDDRERERRKVGERQRVVFAVLEDISYVLSIQWIVTYSALPLNKVSFITAHAFSAAPVARKTRRLARTAAAL